MQGKKKVLILQADSNGGYPVPAVRGGAVSTLVEHLVRGNNEKQLIDLTIMSVYNKQAETTAKDKYPKIRFLWVKRPLLVKVFDWLIMHVVKTLFPRKKLLSFMSIASLLWYIWKASRLLKREPFEKVVLQNNMPLAWAIRLSGYKGEFFYHLHNTPRTNVKCKQVFQLCKAYLCVSKSVGNDISIMDNPIGPVSQNKIRVLYNCIDTNLFREKVINKVVWRNRLGINDTDRVIVFVGRLSEEKGIDQLLLALDYVKTENVKVLIVGSLMYNNIKDSYQEKILAMAKQHSEKVYFTGYISQQELPDIYNLADISVLPSMWDEPAGLTMIESLACGTPVITTRSGGITEYVEGGAVVLDRDENLPIAIAKNIDLLLSDIVMYNEYATRGKNRVKTMFSNQGYIDSFVQCIM